MTCDEFARALQEEEDDAARAHTSGCGPCRQVLASHQAARTLEREQVPLLPLADLSAELRRRRRIRGAAVVVTASAAVLALVAVWSAQPRPDATEAAPFIEPGAVAEAPVEWWDEGDGWQETVAGETSPRVAATLVDEQGAEPEWPLEQLTQALGTWSARDVAVDDAVYAGFGELPQWVALPSSERTGSEDLYGQALGPVQFMLEETL